MVIWLKFLSILIAIKPMLVYVNDEDREIIVIREILLAGSVLI